MARVLALTQLLIVGLGGPLLFLLVKINHRNGHLESLAPLAQFLAAHVLWLFAIPILFAVFGNALHGRVNERAIQGVGIAICAILAAVLGTLIVLCLL